MSSAVSVDLTITGPGWLDCALRLGSRSFTLKDISYGTDAIGDLVRFALAIATGAYRADVSFDHEPRESRIVAISVLDSASGRGPVSISVFEFDGGQPEAPLDAGSQVFIGDCEALDFARAILTAAENVSAILNTENWRFPPPARAIRALKTALTD